MVAAIVVLAPGPSSAVLMPAELGTEWREEGRKSERTRRVVPTAVLVNTNRSEIAAVEVVVVKTVAVLLAADLAVLPAPRRTKERVRRDG